MVIEVQIEGLDPLEFPDETAPEIIQQTVNRLTGQQGVPPEDAGIPTPDLIPDLPKEPVPARPESEPSVFQKIADFSIRNAGEGARSFMEVAGQQFQEIGKNTKRRNELFAKDWAKMSPQEQEETFNFMSGFAGGSTDTVKSTSQLLSKAIGREITPEIAERMALAERSGAKLSISDITGKKHHALFESYFEKNIPSSDVAQEFAANKVRSVEWFKNKLQKELGGSQDLLGAGQIAQESGWRRLQQFYKIAESKYNKVPVKPSTAIETNNLSEIASMHIDEIGQLQTPAIKRILKTTEKSTIPEKVEKSDILTSLGKPFTKVTPEQPVYTWQKLQDDKSTLIKLMKSTTDHNKRRIFKDLVDGMNDDISAFADKVGDPQVKLALDEAVNFYKKGGGNLPSINTFRDRKIANMLASNSPEKIVDGFIKPNNFSDVSRLMNTVGVEGRQAIKQAWLEKLVTKGEEQSFSLRKFSTAFDKYDKKTLSAFLSKEEIEGLTLLKRVSKISSTAENLAGNPSGTGQQIGTISLIWNLVKNPVVASMYIMGTKKAAQVYFNNPMARKLMIEGLKVSPKSARATDIAMKLIGFTSMEDINLQQTVAGSQSTLGGNQNGLR